MTSTSFAARSSEPEGWFAGPRWTFSTAAVPAMKRRMRSWVGAAGAAWGIIGVIGLLTYAIARLGPVGASVLAAPLTPVEWGAVAVSLVFFGYVEGYRAFQLQFSPRVVARAFSLVENPDPLRVALAPAFAMGFFGATRKRLVVSWSLTGGIVLLVMLVRALPQPWRGIVDLGVVVALAWGAAVIMVLAVKAASGRVPGVPTDIPAPSPA